MFILGLIVLANQRNKLLCQLLFRLYGQIQFAALPNYAYGVMITVKASLATRDIIGANHIQPFIE